MSDNQLHAQNLLNVNFKPDTYGAIVMDMFKKMHQFRNELILSQNDAEFDYLFLMTRDKVYYIRKDTHKKILQAEYVFISRVKNFHDNGNGRCRTGWQWGHALKHLNPKYGEIEKIISELPRDLEASKNPIIILKPMIVDTLLAIIFKNMDLTYIQKQKDGDFVNLLGIKNIKEIDETPSEEESEMIKNYKANHEI